MVEAAPCVPEAAPLCTQVITSSLGSRLAHRRLVQHALRAPGVLERFLQPPPDGRAGGVGSGTGHGPAGGDTDCSAASPGRSGAALLGPDSCVPSMSGVPSMSDAERLRSVIPEQWYLGDRRELEEATALLAADPQGYVAKNVLRPRTGSNQTQDRCVRGSVR